MSDDEVGLLTNGYKDMISLPGLRQIIRHREH